jgi:hypothetical protein
VTAPRARARDRFAVRELKARWARFRHSPIDPRISMAARIAVLCIVLAEAAAVGYLVGAPEDGAGAGDLAAVDGPLLDGAVGPALQSPAASDERSARAAGARTGRRAGTAAGEQAGARAGAKAAAKAKKARLAAAAAAAEAEAAAAEAAAEAATEDPVTVPEAVSPPEPVPAPAPAPTPKPAPEPCFDPQGFPC